MIFADYLYLRFTAGRTLALFPFGSQSIVTSFSGIVGIGARRFACPNRGHFPVVSVYLAR